MATPEAQKKFAAEAVKQLGAAEAELQRRSQYKIRRYFQETGPYRRELYPKMMNFFEAGLRYRERAIIAGNRVGKTSGGAYEGTLHLTGEYPDWWKGHRFDGPIKMWAAGTTSEKVKEIVQAELIGPEHARGTGMIPARHILAIRMKSGGTIESAMIRHVSGGISNLTFKSYDQKRPAFEGTQQHVIWLDEEPGVDIYTECLLRTMATGDFRGGLMYMTFTPLQGVTQVVQRFMPGGVLPINGVSRGEIPA